MKEIVYNEKQSAILDVAEELFSSNGYQGTAIRDIAEKANVNIAMISYYFGSKEKMLQALFGRGSQHFKSLQDELLANKSLNGLQKIELFIENRIEKVFLRHKFFRIMICEQMIDKNLEINKMVNAGRQSSVQLIKSILKEGKKDGTINNEADPLLIHNTIIGVIVQTILGKDFYISYHKLNMNESEAIQTHMKKKLSIQIKTLIKNLITNEN